MTPPASRLEDVRPFLEEMRVAHLATADASGEPHVVPVCYAVRGEALCFVVDEKPKATRNLRRLRNLGENPRAAVVVDRWDEDWTRLEYVLVRGEARIVEDRTEFDDAVRALRERYPPYRGMELVFGRNPVVRIAAERVHHWRAARASGVG